MNSYERNKANLNKPFISKKRIEELSKRPWAKIFPEGIKNLKEGVCTICGAKIEGFKNAISHKEYQISGMCQKCQDKVFK